MKSVIARSIFAGLMIVALFVGTSLAALAEGEGYLVLDKPIPDSMNTFIYIFSYDCPFCYKYDKTVMQNIITKLPAQLKFRPFHLKTRGTYGVHGSELFAVLLVRDQENGLNDKDLYSEKSLLSKAKTAYYQAYHDNRERWDAGPDAYLKTGLDAVGMSKQEFGTARNTQKVQKLLNEWDASYEIAKIRGVPAFVVNGKYLIINKSIKSLDSMLELINELAKK